MLASGKRSAKHLIVLLQALTLLCLLPAGCAQTWPLPVRSLLPPEGKIELPRTWAHFNPSGKFLLLQETAATGRYFLIYNLARRAYHARVPVARETEPLWLAPDGGAIIVTGFSRSGGTLSARLHRLGIRAKLVLWRLDLVKREAECLGGLPFPIFYSPGRSERVVSPDGRMLAYSFAPTRKADRKVLRVYDLVHGRELWRVRTEEISGLSTTAEITYICWIDEERFVARCGLNVVMLFDVSRKSRQTVFDEKRFLSLTRERERLKDRGEFECRSATPVEGCVESRSLWLRVSFRCTGTPKQGSFWPHEYWRLPLDSEDRARVWTPPYRPRPEEFQDVSPDGRFMLIMWYVQDPHSGMSRKNYELVDIRTGSTTDISGYLGPRTSWVQFGCDGLVVISDKSDAVRQIPFAEIGVQPLP